MEATPAQAAIKIDASANQKGRRATLTFELRIKKLKRKLYGQRSERTARLLEQLELESKNSSPRRARMSFPAQAAASKTQNVRPFMRKRLVRKPWPDDVERERVVIEGPMTCAGGSRLAKIGEDVTKTLEEIPRRFKLIETVRDKFTCRDCEKTASRRRRSMPRRAGSSAHNC
ncbi:IS66 family transposase [Bradyrhizobium sp. 195]